VSDIAFFLFYAMFLTLVDENGGAIKLIKPRPGYDPAVEKMRLIPNSALSVHRVKVAGLRECWQINSRQWAAERRIVNDGECRFVRKAFNSI